VQRSILKSESREKKTVATTHSGTEITPIGKGLPRPTKSLCPECTKPIDARLYEEDDKVFMEKTCPEHGYFKDIFWSHAKLYHKAEAWYFGEGKGLANPMVTDATRCPEQCGLCNQHVSQTGLANIDLTNRCNLTCPVCFANANVQGYVYEPSLDEIKGMLRTLRDEKPVNCRVVQFSGGEPTIHPDFLGAVSAARDMGFSHIQIASNGLTFNKPDFAMQCKEAGLHTIYLQFDGTERETYLKTRGRDLLDMKLRAMENIHKAEMKIVFVPTIIKGVNDHEVGNILRCAIENIHVLSGISYQPVAFTGRISTKERLEKRYTLTDLAYDVEKQTGLAEAEKDWYPLSCVSPFSKFVGALRGDEMIVLSCHPHCSLGTYFFVDRDKNAVPAPRFLDVEKMFTEMDRLADKTKKARFKAYSKMKAFHMIHKFFDGNSAPEGLTLTRFLQTLNGMLDKEKGRGEMDGTYTYKTLMVAGMHFMDIYNYDVSRVQRCVIHYSTPEGKLYPFCTYNSGKTFRERVEKKFSVPLEDWKRQNSK
jgi:uncharacterized radical SAM superfamily Fe-S cluster-containing enzyme